MRRGLPRRAALGCGVLALAVAFGAYARAAVIQDKGLPTCTERQIQPASDARALAQCGDALVGSGRFWASVVFPDQRPYPTRGRLLIFNGREGGRPVLFAHIYTRSPFVSSFVITFRIKHVRKGAFGTELSAAFPQALGDWGFVDRIKLTLRRKYLAGGAQRSYFNAGCPAVGNAKQAAFVLARTSFFFGSHRPITLSVPKSCGVRE